jgi:hypothetical protein
MTWNIYCIGAGVFGLLMGYTFAWSSRKTTPNGNEVASLLATVLGGTVLTILDQIDCPERLPIYIIGAAAGYLIYVLLLARNLNSNGLILKQDQQPPYFFWHELRHCAGCQNKQQKKNADSDESA